MRYLFLLCLLILSGFGESETLLNKIFCGYQGWFTTPGDGSGNGWTHFKMHSEKPFAKDNCVIDFWPDTTEYQKKYSASQFGSNAALFSPYDYSTVLTHFKWMQEYEIDGIFLQRFGSDIRGKGSNIWKFKNKVFQNIMNAAKQTSKLWSLMYDLSGLQIGQIKSIIMEDWKFLNQQYPNFTSSSNYIKHKGKPLLSIWGVGFNDNRKYSLAQCEQFVNFLRESGISVMLGVPRYWRQGGKDAVTGGDLKTLHSLIVKADVISPWTVGRYDTIDLAKIDAYIYVAQDLKWCATNKVTLMPVIFPGFSWHNLQVSGENPLHPGPYDQIPRKQNGLYFLQRQGIQIAKVGAKTIYVAMFDEMNEGTAIFKCSKNPPFLGDGLRFVSNGQQPDFYLRLTGKIGKLIK